MRIVMQLQDSAGNVVKEVEREIGDAAMPRVRGWWLSYFGNPKVEQPVDEKGEAVAPKDAEAGDLFVLWAEQVLDRLRQLVRDHEGRQPKPNKHAKLLD